MADRKGKARAPQTDAPNHYVEVVAYRGEEVVKRLGPMSLSRAEKVERGMEINMNHEAYFTRIEQSRLGMSPQAKRKGKSGEGRK